MADIQEQTQLANEVSEAISSTNYIGVEIDDVCIPLSIFIVSVAYPASRTSSSKSLRTWNKKNWIRGSRGQTMFQCTTQQARSQHVRLSIHFHVPHLIPVLCAEPIQTAEEDDEETQLRELQAALAM